MRIELKRLKWLTSNRFVAREAFLGEQLAKTLRTVWVIVSRREALARQRLLTIGAREAFSMIRLILVRDAALRYDFDALGALRGKVILVARHAVDFILFRYEALGADGLRAGEAEETVLVELLALVLHLLHARLENLRALVASGRKRLIVALATVKLIVLVAERLVNERQLAHIAKEALLVPVLLLVGEVFGVGADLFLALLARMREQLLVAFDAVRILVLQYVP